MITLTEQKGGGGGEWEREKNRDKHETDLFFSIGWNKTHTIWILTRTVMKYHVSVDCQESYIFPRDYIFPECTALRENIVPRENITILAPPTRDISSFPVDICYIRWSKLMISSKFYVLYDYHEGLVTRLGVCIQYTNWTQTWQLARVLLWCSIVNHCVLCVRGAFLSVSVS